MYQQQIDFQTKQYITYCRKKVMLGKLGMHNVYAED